VCGPCSADVFCYSVLKLITIPLSLAECFDPVDWQTLYHIGRLKLFFQHLTCFFIFARSLNSLTGYHNLILLRLAEKRKDN